MMCNRELLVARELVQTHGAAGSVLQEESGSAVGAERVAAGERARRAEHLRTERTVQMRLQTRCHHLLDFCSCFFQLYFILKERVYGVF